MSARERIARFLGFGSVPPPDPRLFIYPNAPITADGNLLNAREALQLSAVWACVSVISRSISSCDWKVYERSNGTMTWKDGDSLDWILNTRPNPEMPAIALKEALIYAALVWGDGYAEIVRDGAGKVAELWPLEPDRVVPQRLGPGQPLMYRVMPLQGGFIDLPEERVFHLRGPSLTGFVGENMVYRAAKTLVLNQAADAFATSYYRNSTVIGGVLEYEKALDQKSHDRLIGSWKQGQGGPSKSHGPVILENGMKWKPLTADAGSSQMLEARKFQIEETARWFGVPIHMLGSLVGSQGYGTNIEALGLEFVRGCLTPWARRLEQEADFKLFPARGPGARKITRVDMSPLYRADTKTRAEAASILRDCGVLSVNDILRDEGRNTIGPEGDMRVVLLKYAPLEMLEDLTESEIAKNESAAKPPPAPAAAPPGAPGESEPAEPAEPPDASDQQAIARQAVGVLYAQALDRHQKRVEKGMTADKSMARLQTDCDAAASFLARAGLKGPNGALSKCAAAVLIGQPPETAAALLAGGLETEP